MEKEEKKEKKNNKKLIFIIIGIVLFILICILLFLLLRDKGLKPYVEEKGIEVLSATDEYTVTAEPYFKNENGKVIDIDGINVKISTVTYRFYDYSVSEPDEDNYVTHTFKVETITPIEYTEDTSKTYPTRKYTTLFLQPSFFDYYTGTIFQEKHTSKNNTVKYYDTKTVNDDMAFTEVTWEDKTYKVGVRVEVTMKWDGIQKTDNGNGTRTIKDRATTSVEYYIYAPKDYDGLMLFFKKSGTTKQDFLNQLEYSNKYNELVKEANESGEKSEELKEIEERNNTNFKLLDSKVKGEPELKNDTFYVIRVSEIKNK